MKTVLLFFLCINVSLAQVNFSYSNKNGELALVMGEGVSGRVKDAVNGLKVALEKTLDTKCQWATSQNAYAFVFEFGKIVAADKECFNIRLLDDKTLLFSGMEEQSLINAVTYFMEKELDYNWLYPDSSFISYGKRDKLSFTDYNVIDCPAFKQREISPLDASRNSVFGNWALANGLNSRIEFHHIFNDLMNNPDFVKKNPEFFPMVKGERYLPKSKSDHNWQPAFDASGFDDTIASMLTRKLKKEKNISSFSLSMNDSGNFDEDSDKKKKKELNYLKKKNYSDDFYTWANKVIEKVSPVNPELKFGTLAYSNLIEPPSFPINQHIVPFITFDRMRWMNDGLRKIDQDLSAAWAAKVPEIAWYDYVYGSYFLVPRIYPETMKEYLKWGKANKVGYYYAESYPNIGEGPKVWTLSKLLNNPDCNIDSLNFVWCKAAFGKKAAKYMVKYFDNWENFWEKKLSAKEWFVNTSQYLPFNNLAYLRELDEAFLNGNKKLAARALKRAKTDFQKKNAAVYLELSNSYLGFLDWIRQQPEGPVYLKNIKDDTVFLNELEKFMKIYDNGKNYKILTNLLNK